MAAITDDLILPIKESFFPFYSSFLITPFFQNFMPIVLPTRTASSSSLDLCQVQCTQFYRTHKRRMSSADTLHSITVSTSSSSTSSPTSPVMSPAKKKNRPPPPKLVGRDPHNTLPCLDETTANQVSTLFASLLS